MPAGTFQAWKVEIASTEGEPGQTTIWVAKDTRKVVKITATLRRWAAPSSRPSWSHSRTRRRRVQRSPCRPVAGQTQAFRVLPSRPYAFRNASRSALSCSLLVSPRLCVPPG